MHVMRNLSDADAPLTTMSAAYLVGQDRAGRWMAMEAQGRAGGLFASRDAALCYAQSETGYRPGAVSVSVEPIAWW